MILTIQPQMWSEIGLGVLQSLYMTIVATLFAYIIGIPLGISLILTDKDGFLPCKPVHFVLGVVVNIFRSLPFVILAIWITPLTRMIVGTSIGATAMIVPLTITAAPFAARMVESSLKEVPKGKIEAAQAMGSSIPQMIFKVLMSEAKPALLTGAAITIATLLGYTAMAGFIAGGGLGDIALRYGYYRYQKEVMFVCVVLLVIIVQLFQEFGLYLSRVLDKRRKNSSH